MIDETSPREFGTRTPGLEYVRRASAYAVLRNLRGDVGIVRTPHGWYLPGGGIDPGESASDAVVRECREEAGLLVRIPSLLGEATQLLDTSTDGCAYEKLCTFLSADIVGAAAATEPDHPLEWHDAARAIELLSVASHRWAVARAIGE